MQNKQKKAVQYAKGNISNANSRNTFIKNVEAMAVSQESSYRTTAYQPTKEVANTPKQEPAKNNELER
ncbi:hypothetical protein [Iodobacter fluviatilis]|uniref:hypothetical protein n=1 Tax=Iodobacter fluviatilis TaxID=537 RepID=UPI0010213584|nr:hypothetical protein [Iodobacter fluviatilis]